jgi:hypothetical protein
VKTQLEAFAAAIARAATRIVHAEAEVQRDRLMAALDRLFRGIVRKIDREARDAYQQFAGLVGMWDLAMEVSPARLPEIGFVPEIERWSEIIQRYVRMDRVKVGTDYRIKFLGLKLWKKDVYEDRPVFETERHEGIVVPSLENLLQVFRHTGQVSEWQRASKVWLNDEIGAFGRRLAQQAEKVFGSYRAVLLARLDEVERETARSVASAEQFLPELEDLSARLDDACAWRPHARIN